MRLTVFITLIFFLMSCSGNSSTELPKEAAELENLKVYSENEEPSYRLQLQQEQTYGDTGDVILGRYSDIAVDNSNRLFIADRDQLNIKVYEPDGSIRTTLGREGEGPGEFRGITGVQISGSKLFVKDGRLARASVFSTESLKLDYMIPLNTNKENIDELNGTRSSTKHFREDGSSLVSFTKSNLSESTEDWERIQRTVYYYLVDRSREIISDKLFEFTFAPTILVPFGSRRVGTTFEFLRVPIFAFSRDNSIFTASNGNLLIKVYNPDGTYQRAIYYPFENASLEPETVLNEEWSLRRKALQSIEFPETWPAIDNMFIDDEGRIWLSTIVEDQEVYEWWVLEKSGELITKFVWPRDEPIQTVRNGKAYTLKTGQQTGLKEVVRYGIEMTEMGSAN